MCGTTAPERRAAAPRGQPSHPSLSCHVPSFGAPTRVFRPLAPTSPLFPLYTTRQANPPHTSFSSFRTLFLSIASSPLVADRHRLSLSEVELSLGANRISQVCRDPCYNPSIMTADRIVVCYRDIVVFAKFMVSSLERIYKTEIKTYI